MADVSRIWERLYSVIRSSPSRPREPVEIPPDHVETAPPRPRPSPPADSLGAAASGDPGEILPQKDYASIILNQLFLADGREWFTQVEPTVFASTEFLYDGAMRTEPVVIGPRPNERFPKGMVLRNTTVFGPHPYRGGPFTFTFVLGRLPTGNVARQVLEVVEAVSNGLAPGLGASGYAKMGDVVLTGFEKLMGLNGVAPLIGLRETVNPDAGKPFRPGRWALIDMDDPDPAEFWVKDDMLLRGATRESAKPFREADFILFEFVRAPDGERRDLDALPIHAQWKAALLAASKGTPGAWDEAKANFAVMIGAIHTSPDLTWDQGQKLARERRAQLIALHEESVRTALAGAAEDDQTAVRQQISDILRLP